jgi:hypothetical protein
MAERPEDLNFPTTIVTKMIKDCLPTNCKVSKEANIAIAKVSILYYDKETTTFNQLRQQVYLFCMPRPLPTQLPRRIAGRPSLGGMWSLPWGRWSLISLSGPWRIV